MSAPMRGSVFGVFIALSCVTPLALSWLSVVSENVPAPYLDEVFHIPQAQVYCQGRYYDWDDKITTPPGLYISTIIYNKLLRLQCTVYNLRGFNVIVISLTSVLALICRTRLIQPPQKPTSREIPTRDIVTGINLGLFPVLFFFSGLYYTDPSSTLVVLLTYANHLTRLGTKRPSFLNDVYTLILGIVALTFRQTNIFWVVIYMGGLEVIHAIKTLAPEPVEIPKLQTLSEHIKFYAWRYSLGDVHDVSLSLAQPIDVILCVLSIGIAAVSNLPTILRKILWPHGIVLAAFGGFVAWNGGVVLGDKSNHVATIHLAQLLYIWPFFAFFSAPLFIPQLLNLAFMMYQAMTYGLRQKSLTGLVTRVVSLRVATTVLLSSGALAVALLIVRFNTIIHPFTLADNRHYVFYVFRYSILRAWWIRYALAPIYIVCAWLCWAVLQGLQKPSPSRQDRIQSPFISPSQKTPSQSKEDKQSQGSNEADAAVESPPTSTVLMLLVTTTLSLVTAPLVEPRYFILPWVFWRLLVPTSSASSFLQLASQSSSPSDKNAKISKRSSPDSSRRSNDASVLFLETAWFLIINAVTMYIFITRPFYWRAPDGTLQDERVQRFMW
ncbi:hypothetical protein NPX13_g9632 [Xylaria arbuscula]|uniref:Dol-P-Glc:Glc(2)Man(9)GlcNAc(2)-PP-Dol alpha-1,2-glucosyltransferase n=1 Tax=Xylaria arbuscula TaxID=114810 RepID=A0A9W8TI91_9PEZI|nr:hypothetical protein NPX13_g9632 [Xylaria arbuscula]